MSTLLSATEASGKRSKRSLIPVGICATTSDLPQVVELLHQVPQDADFVFLLSLDSNQSFKEIKGQLQPAIPFRIAIAKSNRILRPNYLYLVRTEEHPSLKKEHNSRSFSSTSEIWQPLFSLLTTSFTHKQAAVVLFSGVNHLPEYQINELVKADCLLLLPARKSQLWVSNYKQVGIVFGAPKMGGYLLRLFATTLHYAEEVAGNFRQPRSLGLIHGILLTVEAELGVSLRKIPPVILLRQIVRRITHLGIDQLYSYYSVLRINPAECQQLYLEVLLDAPWYQGETTAWRALQKQVLDPLVSAGNPVKIWLIDCGAGQEAIYLACLLEHLYEEADLPPRYQIIATDPNRYAIDIARSGVFPNSALARLPKAWGNQFFKPIDQDYRRLSERLQKRLQFRQQSAADGVPGSDFQVVVCKKLPEGSSTDTQSLSEVVQDALVTEGYVFASIAVEVSNWQPELRVLDKTHGIYQRKRSSVDESPKSESFRASIEQQVETSLSNYAYQRWIQQQYLPAGFFVNAAGIIEHWEGTIERYLDFPYKIKPTTLSEFCAPADANKLQTKIQNVFENTHPVTIKAISFPAALGNRPLDVRLELAALPGKSLVFVSFTGHSPDQAGANTKEPANHLLSLRPTTAKADYEKEVLVSWLCELNQQVERKQEEHQVAAEELQCMQEELLVMNSDFREKLLELGEVHSDLHHLLNSLDIGMVFVDTKLRVRRFSPVIQRHIRLLQEDLGRSLHTLEGSLPMTKIVRWTEQVIDSGRRVEQNLVDENGSHFLVRILPHRKQEGRIEGAILSIIDVTDGQLAFQEAERYAEQFFILFANSTAHILLVDKQLVLRQGNYLPAEIPVQPFMGRSVLDLIPPERRAEYTTHFETAQTSKRPIKIKDHLPQPDGMIRRFEITIIPLLQENQAGSFLVIARDQTELFQAEEELQKQAKIYQSFYEYGKETITRLDISGRVIDMNFTFPGVEKSDYLGKGLQQIGTPEVIEKNTTAFEKIVERKQGSVEYLTEVQLEDGQQLWMHNLMFPLIIDDQLREVVIKSNDISKLKRSELAYRRLNENLEQEVMERSQQVQRQKEELEEANTYLDSFVNGAAHDLRAPLTQIKGFLSLASDMEEPEQLQLVIGELGKATYNMERTLNGMIELIDFARDASSGATKLNVSQLLYQVMEGLYPMLDEAKGYICVDVEAGLEFCYIEAYFSSICYNLLANSIKYRSYDRQLFIHIKIRLIGSELSMQVQDNGIGIDLERYGQFLFKPFKRLTLEREGTGIGLSTIHKIITRNGGRIYPESRLDEGTTFNVQLVSMYDCEGEGCC